MREEVLMHCRIVGEQNLSDCISVAWDDGSESTFLAIWLRDNCHCAQCGDPSVGRRKLRLTSLDLDVAVDTLDSKWSPDGSELTVNWSDGHQGKFSAKWLYEHRYLDTPDPDRSLHPAPWTEDFKAHPANFSFDLAMQHADVMLEILHTLHRTGLCRISGAPSHVGVLERFARKIGFPQESNFGRIQDLVFDKNKPSIANDIDPLKPHTDEPYRASPPGILMFHCIETDVEGAGESIFVDGFEVAESLRNADPEGFQALVINNLIFRRHFENDVDLSAAFPVISLDSEGAVCGVRINDRVSAPTPMNPATLPIFYRGMQKLLALTEDDNRWMRCKLQPGDIMIFDNHRVLHGRTRLTISTRRWLQWAQVERGDFHSTTRILSDALGKNRGVQPFARGAYG